MAGPFEFLHIKGRTAGSSNELSLDVLDAARAELDGAKRTRTSQPMTGIRPDQGNYRGVAGTSTLSAVPEVERRKKARRARSIRLWTVAVVVVVALVGTGVFFGYRFYQEKVDFSSRFNALVDRFVAIDRTLVDIDARAQAALGTIETDAIEQAHASVPELVSALDDIDRSAEAMKADARFDGDLASLGEIQVAAKARRSMIEAADAIFALEAHVEKEVVDATAAWNKVIDADQKVREATAEANSAVTEEATVEARDKTHTALDEMNEAANALDVLAKADKHLDFKAQQEYLAVRIEALRSALKTSDALLVSDRAAAIAANDSYNAKEREAAKLASLLPPLIGGQIEDAYAEEMQMLQDSYRAARSRVSSADADVRNSR